MEEGANGIGQVRRDVYSPSAFLSVAPPPNIRDDYPLHATICSLGFDVRKSRDNLQM